MSIISSKKPFNSYLLEFKSSTFSVPVLILSTDDLNAIDQGLQEKINVAPEFFYGSPVIVDIQELNKQKTEIELSGLIDIIRHTGLIPVGLRGGNEEQNKNALDLRIPVYSAQTETHKLKTMSPEPVKDGVTTKFVTLPVRSGQRVYASGDLVILSSVSPGAEIISEGSIHVYGILRGRAFAGVLGNTEARIFCLDMRAELISIAGNYKLSENIKIPDTGKPVQVYLQDNALIIRNL